VAKSKPKKTKTTPVERGRDLEAGALVLLGLAVALGAAVYFGSNLAGQLGSSVRSLLYGNFGVVAWIIPPSLATLGILLLLGKPITGFLRALGLGALGTVLLLPLLGYAQPDLAGRLGTALGQALKAGLGNVGLLVPVLLLTLVVDTALRKQPGFILGGLAKRVVLAGQNLTRAYRASSKAGKLLSQASALAERYPEHKTLEVLQSDLKTFRQAPTDPQALSDFHGLLDEFNEGRAKELASKLPSEIKPLGQVISRLTSALASPLVATEGLGHALEERRTALVLEAGTLQSKIQKLTRQSEAAAAALASGVATKALLAAWDAHQTRLEQWREAEGLVHSLEARVDGWIQWAGWCGLAPAAAKPAGLRALLEGGLANTPPAFDVALSSQSTPVDELPAENTFIEEDFASLEGLPPNPAPNPEPGSKPKTVSEPRKNNTAVAVASPMPAVPLSTALTLPSLDLLDPKEAPKYDPKVLEAATKGQVVLIDDTLRHHGVEAKVVNWSRGPTVTRFELEPAPGEKISRVQNLHNDLALALAAGSVRIEAPIPGKSVIGLEVPNTERELVRYSEALQSPGFQRSRETLPMVLGKSIDGEIWVKDLAKMPHLLIAGSTGSGKSVAVNTLITSLLFKYLPTELRFLMIDPKMVELTPYEGIPHLVRAVVTNPADAAGVLLGAVAHMERRYKMLSAVGARNLEQYNQKMKTAGEPTLPYLVIVIDELADLMITAPKEVEQAILRLAQMARATGMHLILATQRPSVDILTSLIKVNIPARMAFAVSSGFDSRTIIDTYGAERLVGQGDMLYHQPGLPKPVRLQGPFLSEAEVHRVAEYLRVQSFEDRFVEQYGSDFESLNLGGPSSNPSDIDYGDPLLKRAADIVLEEGYASVSRLQRRLSVGHARAGKLVDALEGMGIVGPHQGSKPRDVLISRDQLPEYFGSEN
jgi:DNA segregation ATPase FtsK/SpoIIIE, S-DNA-T family